MASRFAALTYIANYWEQNPRIWFSATPDDDREITNKLESFIDDFAEFDLATLPTTDIQQKVGWVILYDQVLKHVNRHWDKMGKGFIPYQQPDNLAAQCLVAYQKYSHPYLTLTDFQFGFLLMPVRHTHQLGRVKFVLSAAWARLQTHIENGKPTEFLRNYIKATYTRLAKFIRSDDPETYQDYRPPASEHLHKFITINMGELMELFDSDKAYLDQQCYRNDPANIHLITRLIKPQLNKSADNTLLTQASSFFAGLGNKHGSTPLVVSLSGGVDSMVCSYLLWALDIKFQALHINYSNRGQEVCAKEELLIRYWCALLGVPLRVVRTDEINRPRCMEHGLREVYESYTRDRRFNGYLSCADKDILVGDSPCVRVVLGHNQDDTIENILTNLAGQSHYDNLRGMLPVSYQTHRDQQIQFLRPLLSVSKSEIYSFANQHQIPYLVDSTPKWSQRGKIRDIVRPAIESWNPEMLGALQILADRLTDMQTTLDALIPTNSGKMEFADILAVPKTLSYWSRVFTGIPITQKTLREWIGKLEYLAQHPGKLIANQQIKFRLAKTNELGIVRVLEKGGKSFVRISIL
jgi:tRNA(Ile)-lysidine synthetase-like protein